MSSDLIIGMIAVLSVALLLAIKLWGYKTLKFKMDESAIVNFLETSADQATFVSAETISAETQLAVNRVSEVCAQSKTIYGDKQEIESWQVSPFADSIPIVSEINYTGISL